VKDVRYKARMIRAFIGLGMIVSLLVMLTGCWPFNTFPVAYFTASPLSGPAPLSVAFSAMLSEDPDGFILKWEWDFGDGESAVGESISHTYDTPGTYDVTLRVTDDDSATATASRTITVTAAEEPGGAGAGPTASFTATPLVGAAPLTVTFNASASAYAGHAITYYSWDFGDGVNGTGMTTTHTYAPLVTTTYNVVLRIIAADNTEGTTTKSITATVTPATPPSTAPTASFTPSPNSGTVPFKVDFDASASKAAANRTIGTYHWSFGDGSFFSGTKAEAEKVSNTYFTAAASQNFTVTLTVIDDLGSTHSYSRTVTAKNGQPVAGFEMQAEAGWVTADVQTSGLTLVVYFRSQTPSWTVDTLAAEPQTTAPTNYDSGKRNLSYDPEGKYDTYYGISSFTFKYGDGDINTLTIGAFGPVRSGTLTHTFTISSGSKEFTVILEVTDKLGAKATYSRKVKLGY